MSNKSETIADIVAEMHTMYMRNECPWWNDGIYMRGECPWWDDGGDCVSCPSNKQGKQCPFGDYADRIEAAMKHEADNARALREALTTAINKLRELYD